MLHTLRFFFSSKCRLFHNATFFGSRIIHILHTGCAKISIPNSGAKRLRKEKKKELHVASLRSGDTQYILHNVRYSLLHRFQNFKSDASKYELYDLMTVQDDKPLQASSLTRELIPRLMTQTQLIIRITKAVTVQETESIRPTSI